MVVLLVMIGMRGMGQTNVSGLISTNTHWDLLGSPYIITGNTLVQQGSALTIDPGVVIKFDGGKALQINGELIAIGTSSNRILFNINVIVIASICHFPTSNGTKIKIHKISI